MTLDRIRRLLPLLALALSCSPSAGSPADAGITDGKTADAAAKPADGKTQPLDSHGPDSGPGDAPARCPEARPQNGAACDLEDECVYGQARCSCLDPGPQGIWACMGGAGADAASNSSMCPAELPNDDDPCPDAGAVDNCRYVDLTCSCAPKEGWTCII